MFGVEVLEYDLNNLAYLSKTLVIGYNWEAVKEKAQEIAKAAADKYRAYDYEIEAVNYGYIVYDGEDEPVVDISLGFLGAVDNEFIKSAKKCYNRVVKVR